MVNQSYNVSGILLAGGNGSRMKSDLPKQYLSLGTKRIAQYAFDCLQMVPELSEIIVVCEKEYRHFFESAMPDVDVSFAEPGARRQDSVYNGYLSLTSNPDLVCIHDAARPFITPNLVKKVLEAAWEYGAASTAVPLKFTVKEVSEDKMVTQTPDRSKMWEVQTPQVLRAEVLSKGFDHAHKKKLTVTDDVSLAELIGMPVKLVEGDYNNLKITTPEDLYIAEAILKNQSPAELQLSGQ